MTTPTRTSTSRCRPTLLSRIRDGLVGGLTPGVGGMVLGTALVCGAVVATTASRTAGRVRGTILGLVAVDLVGGLVTFQLGPTRERFTTSSRRSRAVFVLSHLQPFALPLTRQGTWRRAAARYTSAVAASVVLEAAPLPPVTRRGAAVAIAVAAAAVDVTTDPPGHRWLGPVYLLKVIGGHGGVAAQGTGRPDR